MIPWLIISGYSPILEEESSQELKQLITSYPQSRPERNELHCGFKSMLWSALASFSFFQFYIVQDPLSREWCCPQRTGSSYIN